MNKSILSLTINLLNFVDINSYNEVIYNQEVMDVFTSLENFRPILIVVKLIQINFLMLYIPKI